MIRRGLRVPGVGDCAGGSWAPSARTRGTRAMVATGEGRAWRRSRPEGLPQRGASGKSDVGAAERKGKGIVKVRGRKGEPVDPARHLGSRRRRAVQGSGTWPCRRGEGRRERERDREKERESQRERARERESQRERERQRAKETAKHNDLEPQRARESQRERH